MDRVENEVGRTFTFAMPMTAGCTGVRNFFAVLMMTVTTGMVFCPGVLAQQPASSVVQGEAINQWISNLADDDFQVREDAESCLLETGSVAIPFLEQHRQASDHELRLRVIRIVGLIRHQKTERLVKGFLAGKNSLPGWETYSGYLGSSDVERESFVLLFKERESTLQRHENEENKVSLLKELLKEFSEEGVREATFNTNLMTCLSMQVIEALPQISAEKDLPQIRRVLSQYFAQAAFVELAGENHRFRELHRQAAIQWVQYPDPENVDMTRRITVSLTLSLPEGLPVAVKSLEMSQPNHSGAIRYALELIGMYGDESHIDLLSRYLDNSLVLYNPRFVDKDRNQTVYNVQVGDLALSTMIHLAGRNYQDYGLNLIEKSYQGQPLPIRYSGFLSNPERTAAKEKWIRDRTDRERKD